jgi:Fe-S-cluster containining protein
MNLTSDFIEKASAVKVTSILKEAMEQGSIDPSLFPEMLNVIIEGKHTFEQYCQTFDPKEVLLGIFEQMDAIENGIPEQYKQQITCRKGCSFCCNIEVSCTNVEADAIMTYCQVNNIPVDQDRLQLHSSLSMEERPVHNDSACVFLVEETKTCRIYPVRPLMCRKYFATTDPALCNPKIPLALRKSIGLHLVMDMELITASIISSNNITYGNMAKLLLEWINGKNGTLSNGKDALPPPSTNDPCVSDTSL